MQEVRLTLKKRAFPSQGRVRFNIAHLTDLGILEGDRVDLINESTKKIVTTSIIADTMVRQGQVRVSEEDLKSLGLQDEEEVLIRKAQPLQEKIKKAAADAGAATTTLRQLAAGYYDIRAGIGDAKAPDVYGAFPMDPYSHTPAQGGARQPGLTGQVKEDFLCRMGELGVFVKNGEVHFRPELLRPEEFVTAPTYFAYVDTAGIKRRLRLKAGELAFTYCQVPIIYRRDGDNSLIVFLAKAAKLPCQGLRLDADTSRLVFERAGQVVRIEVSLAGSPT